MKYLAKHAIIYALCGAAAFVTKGASAADAPKPEAATAKPIPAPTGAIALEASKAYTKLISAYSDLQQANATQADRQKAFTEAQAALKSIQDKARTLQSGVPEKCGLNANIEWVESTPSGQSQPCTISAPVAKPEAKK